MSVYDIAQVKQAFRDSFGTGEVIDSISVLKERIQTVPIQAPNLTDADRTYIQTVVEYCDNVIGQLQAFENTVHKQKLQELENQITDLSHTLYGNSIDLEEHDGGVDNIRNIRNLSIEPEIQEILIQRIRAHTDFKYPALELGCRDGEWTQYLVAADPLYIMDKYQEFLDSTNNKFPELFQRRLRKYINKNYDFSALPQNQFGLIFSFNHFNYISLDTITEVLKSIPSLLRPGGIFLFSYNDGDKPKGVGMAENFGQTYVPKSILIPTCQANGLEIFADYGFDSGISWLEVRKPGELKTVKRHQVLGKVMRRNDTI